MQSNEQLIALLNQSDSVSGTDIGAALGVSRAAVQKRIQLLVANGLPIKASSGKGYTLDREITLLSEVAIKSALLSPLIQSVEVLQSVESTNSHLLQQDIINGRAKLCVAESQVSGRGRRGNDWQSAPYRNVMLSLSWGFDHWPETITGLGLAVSLVVAEYLNDFILPVVDDEKKPSLVQIKWPNDLMVNGDKLGGILIDVAGESSGACNVIVGIGLNVHQPDWSGEGGYRWQDLHGLGVAPDRNRLIAGLSSALVVMLDEFSRTGFEPLATRWNELSSYVDRRIRVGNTDGFIEGVMHGVDSIGALLLVDDQGRIQRITDSNVSVRLISHGG